MFGRWSTLKDHLVPWDLDSPLRTVRKMEYVLEQRRRPGGHGLSARRPLSFAKPPIALAKAVVSDGSLEDDRGEFSAELSHLMPETPGMVALRGIGRSWSRRN